MSSSVPDEFTFVAGGDMIGPYKTLKGTNDPDFKQVYNLFQKSDLGFANQEGAIFDLANFVGYPSAETGGGYPLFPLAVASEIRAMGINMVSMANNHAIDWGMEGIVATLKSLEEVGITQAGGGLSDTQARAPAYIKTPKSKVALVSVTSSFPSAAVAGPPVVKQGVTSRPRPGISVLHIRQIRLIHADQLRTLCRIAGPVYSPVGADGDEIRISDQYFRASSVEKTMIEANPTDKAAIFDSIREARKNADFVVFSLHAHEADINANETPSPDNPRPVGFFNTLFHEAIDAGVDTVIRTGPHAVDGIEIYRGKPIFYSLGSLFLCFQGVRIYTTPSGQRVTFPDEWFETVIPVCRFRGGQLCEVKLYPAEIESSTAPTDGFPRLASSGKAKSILERVKALSAAFGTSISIEENTGIIRLL